MTVASLPLKHTPPPIYDFHPHSHLQLFGGGGSRLDNNCATCRCAAALYILQRHNQSPALGSEQGVRGQCAGRAAPNVHPKSAKRPSPWEALPPGRAGGGRPPTAQGPTAKRGCRKHVLVGRYRRIWVATHRRSFFLIPCCVPRLIQCSTSTFIVQLHIKYTAKQRHIYYMTFNYVGLG